MLANYDKFSHKKTTPVPDLKPQKQTTMTAFFNSGPAKLLYMYDVPSYDAEAAQAASIADFTAFAYAMDTAQMASLHLAGTMNSPLHVVPRLVENITAPTCAAERLPPELNLYHRVLDGDTSLHLLEDSLYFILDG